MDAQRYLTFDLLTLTRSFLVFGMVHKLTVLTLLSRSVWTFSLMTFSLILSFDGRKPLILFYFQILLNTCGRVLNHIVVSRIIGDDVLFPLFLSLYYVPYLRRKRTTLPSSYFLSCT